MSKTMERILGAAGNAGNAGAVGDAGGVRPASISALVPEERLGAAGNAGNAGGAGAVGDAGGVRPASISALVPEERLAPAGGGIPQLAERQPRWVSYEEMFRRLFPYKPLTPEELEWERKKERREKTFAAISDGISALSNLFFTTQYAPNMYSGQNTASQKAGERWKRLAAERNANMKAYLDGLARARRMDEEHDAREREWERQLGLDKIKQERDKAADERAAADEERKRELHPLAVAKAEADAKTAGAKAEWADEYEASRVRRNEAATGASEAAAAASHARARHYGLGGGAGAKGAELEAAYRYWESLTPKEKDEWRARNGRQKVVRTGTDAGGRRAVPVYEERYMEDDEDFIGQVWEQRKGYLRSNGRGGEIATGGYNIGFRPGSGKPVAGFGGNGGTGRKRIDGFGG